MRKRHIIKLVTKTILATTLLSLMIGTSVYAFSFTVYPTLSATYTKEMGVRISELLKQGYTPYQTSDQINEEFDKVDGRYNTGGIDGKLLDGSEAPNDANGDPKPTAPVGGNTGNTGNNTGSGGNTSTGTTEGKPVHTHDWSETVTKNPTCKEEGVKTFTCSCGDKKTEKIAKVNHEYEVSGTSAGTCVEIGRTIYTCKMCDDSYSVDGEYGEHIYTLSEDGVKPTCTENGVKYTVCAVCGDKVEEILPATDHNVNKNGTLDKNATCTEDGIKTYRCTTCGFVDREEVIPAIGHEKSKELNVIKEATGLNTGEGNYFCVKCGEVLETVEIPAMYEIKDIAVPVTVCVIVVMVIGATAVIILKRKRLK